MDVLNKVTGWLKGLTETGLALIALGVVLQIIFGAAVPFLKIDIIGSVVDITKQLGSEGLVGLVAVWVLLSLYNRKPEKAA